MPRQIGFDHGTQADNAHAAQQQSTKEPFIMPQLSAPQNLFMPLAPLTWGQTRYSYAAGDQFGIFVGTDGATIFAPETGKLTVFPDNSWVITVDGGDHERQWIGVSPLQNVPAEGAVFAGQPLGTSKGNFRLSLWITPKGATRAEAVDPAQTLINFKGKFVDFIAPSKDTGVVANVPRAPQAREITDLTHAGVSNIDAKKDRTFTAGHLAVGIVGSLALGFIIAKGVSSR